MYVNGIPIRHEMQSIPEYCETHAKGKLPAHEQFRLSKSQLERINRQLKFFGYAAIKQHRDKEDLKQVLLMLPPD